MKPVGIVAGVVGFLWLSRRSWRKCAGRQIGRYAAEEVQLEGVPQIEVEAVRAAVIEEVKKLSDLELLDMCSDFRKRIDALKRQKPCTPQEVPACSQQ